MEGSAQNSNIRLPEPKKKGNVSLEETLDQRKSIRDYVSGPLTKEELSQMLWAAGGKNKWGKITIPSAGARYPLIIYVVIGEVDGVKPGLYKYTSRNNVISLVKNGDLRDKLSANCFNQRWVREAPMSIVICADYQKTTSAYGERGKRYIAMEAGHAGQNIYLEVVALGLGTVAVGAFDDKDVKGLLGVSEDPLYIFPVGRTE